VSADFSEFNPARVRRAKRAIAAAIASTTGRFTFGDWARLAQELAVEARMPHRPVHFAELSDPLRRLMHVLQPILLADTGTIIGWSAAQDKAKILRGMQFTRRPTTIEKAHAYLRYRAQHPDLNSAAAARQVGWCLATARRQIRRLRANGRL
jgi:hypothetical protein